MRVEELNRIELDATEMSWLKQDEFWIRNAPNVLNTVPLGIDLLILDGGEFSTLAEYKLLNARVRGWIILDDTRTRKCEGIIRLALEDKNFQIIYQSDERHGTAILKRVYLDNG